MVASWVGELPVVKELVRAGAKTDAQDQVCCYNHRMMEDRLCIHDCVCCVQEGLTSLMLATQKDRGDIVEVLLDANADPNITENVRIELEMVAMLFSDFCMLSLSTDCWMDRVAFCCKIWQS